MRLATPEQVLSILGIQSSTGSLANAGVALDAVFSVMENALDTELLQTTRTDQFDISPLLNVDPSLRLSGSFVFTEDDLTVTDNTTGAVIDPSTYSLDADHGVVHLVGTMPYGKRVLAVTYTTGFVVSDKDENVLEGFPEALADAQACLACAFIQMNPTNVSKDKAKALGINSSNGYDMRARQIMARYTRPRGTVVWNALTSIE